MEFSEYLDFAIELIPHLPERLHDNYTEYMEMTDVGHYTLEHLTHPMETLTYELLVANAICDTYENELLDQAISTYRENRRYTKKNWLLKVKHDMEDLSGKASPIRSEAEARYHLNSFDRSIKNKKSVEELMQERYEELQSWRYESSALLSDFYFFGHKNVKIQSTNLMNDITLESLIIIKDEFNGSIKGHITNYPSFLYDFPIFNYRKNTVQFDIEYLKKQLILFRDYSIDGITVRTEKETENVPENAYTDLQSLTPLEFRKKYEITTNQSELDLRDSSIVASLFNMLSGDNLKDRHLKGKISWLAEQAFGVKTVRRQHIEEVKQRLDKIAKFSQTIIIRNKGTNEIAESLSISFISRPHIYKEGNTDYFDVIVSEDLINEYIEKKTIFILSSYYDMFKSEQSKAILIIMQKERIQAYLNGKDNITWSVKDFRCHLKMDTMRSSSIGSEIRKHLKSFKDNGVVIKDFTTQKNTIEIQFTPLDDLEIRSYNLRRNPDMPIRTVIDAPQ